MPSNFGLTGFDPAYSASLKRFPPLSEQAERDLHPHLSDVGCRNQLVQGTLRLAVKIAWRFVGRGIEFDDLIGEANLALVLASRKFDPAKGTRFGTFATTSIRGHLLNLFRGKRLPVGGEVADASGVEDRGSDAEVREEVGMLLTKLSDRDRAVLVARLADGETYQAIADRLDMSVEGVRKIEKRAMAAAKAAAAGRTK